MTYHENRRIALECIATSPGLPMVVRMSVLPELSAIYAMKGAV